MQDTLEVLCFGHCVVLRLLLSILSGVRSVANQMPPVQHTLLCQHDDDDDNDDDGDDDGFVDCTQVTTDSVELQTLVS